MDCIDSRGPQVGRASRKFEATQDMKTRCTCMHAGIQGLRRVGKRICTDWGRRYHWDGAKGWGVL